MTHTEVTQSMTTATTAAATFRRSLLGERVHYIGHSRDFGTIEDVRDGFYRVRWDRPGAGAPVDSYDPDVIVRLGRIHPEWR